MRYGIKIGGEQILRIDASQMFGQGGIRIKGGAGTFADTLREGDVIRAEVLSNDKGVIEMKAENGQMFKAKLDASLTLLPGDEVELEVGGKDKGLSITSVTREELDINETSGRQGQQNTRVDNSLQPYLDKLTSLNMPATKEAARLMQSLLAQNPGLTLDEAAFLVSNKLTGNESLMKAALALLQGSEKTDAMIGRLLTLLSQSETGGGNLESGVKNSESRNAAQPQPIASMVPNSPASAGVTLDAQSPALSSQTSVALAAHATNTTQLTDLLTMILSKTTAGSETLAQGQQAVSQDLPPIIPESGSLLQTANVENLEIITQNDTQKAQVPAEGVRNQPILPQNATVLQEGLSAAQNSSSEQLGTASQPQGASTVSFGDVPQSSSSEAQGGAAQNLIPLDTQPPQGSQGERAAGQPQGAQLAALSSELSGILSEIPEFRSTPPDALERFSSMLLRIAGENAGGGEKLESLLDKLFTRVGLGEAGGGEKLKGAREELFARLALMEETISRAAPSARVEMLDQVQKLMDHVRVLNSIDSFAYMQLPVKLGDERKTADLYIFKRKGGRKPDPENVNILLALDLENMGHWESLINIKNRDVSLQMEVAGAKEKEHFSVNTVLLHDMLEEAGFRLVNADITYSEKETTPLTALASLDRYTVGKAGKIDFKI